MVIKYATVEFSFFLSLFVMFCVLCVNVVVGDGQGKARECEGMMM
jgi:hypothetical protein